MGSIINQEMIKKMQKEIFLLITDQFTTWLLKILKLIFSMGYI